jgi:hypothetical protein
MTESIGERIRVDADEAIEQALQQAPNIELARITKFGLAYAGRNKAIRQHKLADFTCIECAR